VDLILHYHTEKFVVVKGKGRERGKQRAKQRKRAKQGETRKERLQDQKAEAQHTVQNGVVPFIGKQNQSRTKNTKNGTR
jgi:hypothetical protein